MLNGVDHIDRLVERFGAACARRLTSFVLEQPRAISPGRPAGGSGDTAFGELADESSAREAIASGLFAGGVERISNNVGVGELCFALSPRSDADGAGGDCAAGRGWFVARPFNRGR